MKAILLSALLISPLALAASDTADSSFYKALAEGGIGEVDLGAVAARKAADTEVKDFAAMMVKDHSAANQQLKSLAATKNVSLPDGPGLATDTKKAELEVLSGHAFDKSYISNQIKAHKSTVALLQKEISSGKDADAQALAKKLLPTVQSHLHAAQRISASLGKSQS